MPNEHDPLPPNEYHVDPPEHVGEFIRLNKTKFPVTCDPDRKIGFTVHTVWGSDVFLIPEGQEPSLDCEDDANHITTEDGLKEGMRLLVPTLLGYGLGIMSKNEAGDLACRSTSGDTGFFLDFAHDRPPLEDGTPAPPRWVCGGSANLRALKKLTLTR